eukprot:TRINITY_DN29441_c0_g1_i1.p1 TRINITY_DN29441_c0_g1~~TRINITY_DN29441_c0_g1_i1.p1  ORF type:complete len:1315 (-),score=221.95 TRINITY_DN29441_c0_g1_i1:109-4053(-)
MRPVTRPPSARTRNTTGSSSGKARSIYSPVPCILPGRSWAQVHRQKADTRASTPELLPASSSASVNVGCREKSHCVATAWDKVPVTATANMIATEWRLCICCYESIGWTRSSKSRCSSCGRLLSLPKAHSSLPSPWSPYLSLSAVDSCRASSPSHVSSHAACIRQETLLEALSCSVFDLSGEDSQVTLPVGRTNKIQFKLRHRHKAAAASRKGSMAHTSLPGELQHEQSHSPRDSDSRLRESPVCPRANLDLSPKWRSVRISSSAQADGATTNGDCNLIGWDPNALARSIHPLPDVTSPEPKERSRVLRRTLTSHSEASAGWLGGGSVKSLSAASGLGDLAAVCPRTPDEVIALQHVQRDGFSRDELALMQRTFHWFTEADAFGLKKSLLLDAFVHLGYLGPLDVLASSLQRIALDVSAFSTFSFSEFIEVAERLSSEETLRIRKAFDAAAVDKKASPTRRLPDAALPQMLRDLGCIPLNRTIYEILAALRSTDEGETSQEECDQEESCASKQQASLDLDFELFNDFLASYRAAEGFNREMLSNASATFKAACAMSAPKTSVKRISVETDQLPQLLLPADHLLGALLKLFGRQAEPSARAFLMAAGLPCKHDLKPSSARHRNNQKGKNCNLLQEIDQVSSVSQADFLIWARRFRELCLKPFWERFVHAVDNVTPGHTGFGPKLAMTNLSAAMSGFMGEQNKQDSVQQLPACLPESPHKERGILASEAVIKASQIPNMTLSQAAVEEAVARAGLEEKEDLDFDCFVKFVQACLRKSGFSSSEVEELKTLFMKFDHNQSGELEAVEFRDLLRYLGHEVSLEDVYRSIDRVDIDNSGTLDFQEFLRQTRLHRESERRQICSAFARAVDDTKDSGSENPQALFHFQMDSDNFLESMSPYSDAQLLPSSQLASVFHKLGVLPQGEQQILARLLEEAGNPAFVDLDSFASLAPLCRAECASARRRHAGFSNSQVALLRRLFDMHCKPGLHELGLGELLWLLVSIGIRVDTLQARQEVMELLEEARTTARQKGMSLEDIGMPNSSKTPFWALVHLLRAYCQRSEGTKVDQEQCAADECRFSTAEAQELREIFLSWAQPAAETPSTLPPTQKLQRQGSFQLRRQDSLASAMSDSEVALEVSASVAAAVAELVSGSKLAWLSLANVKSLLKSLGMRFTTQDMETLSCTVKEMPSTHSRRLGEKVQINFAGFLRLLRWMMDTNFADINVAAERVLKLKLQRERHEAEAEAVKARRKKLKAASAAAVAARALRAAGGTSQEPVKHFAGPKSPSWPLRVHRGSQLQKPIELQAQVPVSQSKLTVAI